MKSLLEPFKVILLDMNGTFMNGCDRFSDGEDYAATYRTIGGQQLSNSQVNTAVQACYDLMATYYENPARCDNFPQVADTLHSLPQTDGMAEEELIYLERVIALHELGTVSPEYSYFLQQLATTHELGLVTNIWSQKQFWLEELERVGVRHLFKVLVFSSDSSSMKPSPKLYEEALSAFTVEREQVVFIGDSLQFDIRGAKAVGLATIWIQGVQKYSNEADAVIKDLLDLQKVSSL